MKKAREQDVSIVDIMKKSFCEYALSVIHDRALPQLSDGFKPIHRRILYSMFEEGQTNLVKSMAIVGDVLKKYHPHGDTSVYDAMVGMLHPQSLRYPFIDGQGNFGLPIDGESKAAAGRYTEAKLNKFGEYIFKHIKEKFCEFKESYDSRRKEPVTIPTTVPIYLINGAQGIAVGYGTKMCSHNLGEVCEALNYVIDNKKATVEDIFNNTSFQGPDFPTRCTITNKNDLYSIYKGEQNRLNLSGEYKLNGKQLIVTSLPHGVTVKSVVTKIAALSKKGSVDYLSGMKDETDSGVRLIFIFKRSKDPSKYIQHLLKSTGIISSFSLNFCALDGEYIRQGFNFVELLKNHIENTEKILMCSAKFHVVKLSFEQEILNGIIIARKNLKKVIPTILKSTSKQDGIIKLRALGLTPKQALYVWDIKVNHLSSFNIDKILLQLKQIEQELKYYNGIIKSKTKLKNAVKKEFNHIAKNFSDNRKTKIINQKQTQIKKIQKSIIHADKKTIYISKNGYISLVKNGIATDDMWIDSFPTVKAIIIADNGRAYPLPIGSIQRKPRHVRSLLNNGEITPICICDNNSRVLFVAIDGKLKYIKLDDFNPRSTGKKIFSDIKYIKGVFICEKSDTFVVSGDSRVVHFPISKLRTHGVGAGFVRGMKVKGNISCVGKYGNDGIVVINNKGEVKRLLQSEIGLKSHSSKGMQVRGDIVGMAWTETINIDNRIINLVDIPAMKRKKKSSITAKIVENNYN